VAFASARIGARVPLRRPRTARRDSRRRARRLRREVMRRRPIAVYRVIDEQELLGGDDIEGLDAAWAPVPDPPARPVAIGRAYSWRERATRRMGWASTASAVAVLLCIALVLLHTASPARTPVTAPTASRAVGTAPRVGRILRVAAARSLQRTRSRRPGGNRSRIKRPRRRSGAKGSWAAGPRPARVAPSRRARVVPAVPVPPSAAGPHYASAQEFGFER
jgi:hypothetical protein